MTSKLNNNKRIHPNFEVSSFLPLEENQQILSEHRFDWNEKNEWITIAKELTKLYFWGEHTLLEKWLNHIEPNKIFYQIYPYFEKISISELICSFLPKLNQIYNDIHKI